MSKIKLTPSISNIDEQVGEESKSSLGEGTGSSKDPIGPSSLTSNKYVEAPKQTYTEVNLFSYFRQIAAYEKLAAYEAYKNSFEGSGGSPTFNTELRAYWDGAQETEEMHMVHYYEDGYSDEESQLVSDKALQKQLIKPNEPPKDDGIQTLAQNLSYLQNRQRLVSNTTEKTNGSTQHSDDVYNKSNSVDGLTGLKNLSNNVSDLSQEDNSNSGRRQTLSKAYQNTLSTGQLPSMPLDGFADKVRKVAFEGQTPPLTKERAISGDEGQTAEKSMGGLFKNRRSNSYFYDAGNPSWNESQELSNSRSMSYHDISRDGEEETKYAIRGYSDLAAEEVNIPSGRVEKHRSMSKNDIYEDRSPMGSPFMIKEYAPSYTGSEYEGRDGYIYSSNYKYYLRYDPRFSGYFGIPNPVVKTPVNNTKSTMLTECLSPKADEKEEQVYENKNTPKSQDNPQIVKQDVYYQRRAIVRSDFTYGVSIGTGAYGTVYRVQFNSYEQEKRTVAKLTRPQYYGLKEMLLQRFVAEGRIKEVYIERCVLANLNHPSIVKLYQSFKNGNKLYLLLEFCQNGSLTDFLTKQKSLSMPLATHFTAEIVQALEYLRNQYVVHRDLKPGNIVLDRNYHLKLIDFATCKVFNKEITEYIKTMRAKFNIGKSHGYGDDTDLNHDQRVYSLVGTEEYIAPETINDGGLSYASDLWSLGVILYQMLNGDTPFKGNSPLETFKNIREFTEIKYSRDIDESAKDLIERLLRKEPDERIGAIDIAELKSHKFFENIDWTSLRDSNPPYNPPPRNKHRPLPIITKRNKTTTSFVKNNDSPNSLNTSGNMSSFTSPIKLGEQSPNKIYSLASFGGVKDFEGIKVLNADSEFFMQEEEKKEASIPGKQYLRTGTLRKKGLILWNEREVKIDAEGILTYYHFEKPDIPKGNIDLKHHTVHQIRILYAGRHKQNAPYSNKQANRLSSNSGVSKRPIPSIDDEIRIYMRNKESETFIFKCSKQKSCKTTDNPPIESWERTIRKFTKKIHVIYLH